jgi:hypothetical protein
MRGRPAPQSLDDFLGIVLTAFRKLRFRDYRMSTYENASWRRRRLPHVALSFMRMSVSIRGMFMSELAMFQSCSGVLLGICMLTGALPDDDDARRHGGELEFLILTAARAGEVLGARWSEIDLEAKVWTVPAARMKSGRQYCVPLSGRALAILAVVAKARFGDFVFPGRRHGSPLSDGARQQPTASDRVSETGQEMRPISRVKSRKLVLRMQLAMQWNRLMAWRCYWRRYRLERDTLDSKCNVKAERPIAQISAKRQSNRRSGREWPNGSFGTFTGCAGWVGGHR